MASTFGTYHLGVVASQKFLVTENMHRITVSIFARRRQLEARNSETAKHIDKRMSDVVRMSSRITCYKTISNLGPSPQGVFLQPREKWTNAIMHENCLFSRIAQNFLPVCPC